LKDEVTVYENALVEPCLMSNPLVVGEFGLRFYAAVPITTSEGFNIGAICIVDKKVRPFTPQDRKKLEWVAKLIQIEIEKRA